MHALSHLPEQGMRAVRWILLIGWILLIASLFWPALGVDGNQVFWGSVVPMGLMIIAAISHELWRRICPLAFISQLARFLDRQRRRPGKRGKPEIVKIQQESWLGQHHIQLQWSLLIAGLCLRLLVVNNNAHALAILLLCTLTAAVVVGWAYGGKAWCQYFCPMGPVQQVVTGARSPLGSTAHVNSRSRITQSMCRTISRDGREQSACVACQANCIDIDAERTFWESLRGKRGLEWAWGSYIGLILAFFMLLPLQGSGEPGTALTVIAADVPVVRLVAIPVLLSLAAFISYQLTSLVERWLIGLYERQGHPDAAPRARQHTRQLTTFLAVNIFFSFVSPFQEHFSGLADDLLRSVVLALTATGLFRGWTRNQATYRRESTSDNLRKQLRDLPGLEKALDGRSLDALSPEEVFTLVKALPAIGQQKGRQIYSEVMADMLKSGRLSHASALLELQELRRSLGLSQEEHHMVLGLLAQTEPALVNSDAFERQLEDLRQDAALERIEELMRMGGLDVLVPAEMPTALMERLEQLRQSSGLDDDAWGQCLQRFGPESEREHQRLEALTAVWQTTAGLAARLDEASQDQKLLSPLARILEQRQWVLQSEIAPARSKALMPPLADQITPSGTLEEAMELLWCDPSPETAGWVLMLDRLLASDQTPQPSREPRSLGTGSVFFEQQLKGNLNEEQIQTFEALLQSTLFNDMAPSGLVWLEEQGRMQRYEPGEIVMQEGDRSDHLAVVTHRQVLVKTPSGQVIELGPGEVVGELGVIIGTPRSATVVAGEQGAALFNIPEVLFEELLNRSHDFNRGLIKELATRVVSSNQS